MRVLVVSDKVSEFLYSQDLPLRIPSVDLVLAAGDLPAYYLEYLATTLPVPLVYVHGNHGEGFTRDLMGNRRPAEGCINAHRRVVRAGGVTIAGFEGCTRYKPGAYQYSQSEYRLQLAALWPRLASARLLGGRGADILLTHAPPIGPSAGDDLPHQGVRAFNDFHRWFAPVLHVHGHVHLYSANPTRVHYQDGVRVVNAFGYTTIDFDPGARP